MDETQRQVTRYPGETAPWCRRGDSGSRVLDLQLRLLTTNRSAYFDEQLETRLKGWQQAHGLRPTGFVDNETARELGWT
jgi:hypothetical protein